MKRDLVIGDHRWTPEQVQAFADHMGITYQYAGEYIRRLAEDGAIITEASVEMADGIH